MTNNHIFYKKGCKYQLKKDFIISVDIFPDADIITEYLILSKDGFLLIKKDYVWNGPNGVIIHINSFMKASLVHDALYQLIRLGHLSIGCRDKADMVLRNICEKDGMNKYLAYFFYKIVRIFGETFTDPSIENEIEIAP